MAKVKFAPKSTPTLSVNLDAENIKEADFRPQDLPKQPALVAKMLTNPVTESGLAFAALSSSPAFEDYNPEAADDFNNDDDTSLFSDN